MSHVNDDSVARILALITQCGGDVGHPAVIAAAQLLEEHFRMRQQGGQMPLLRAEFGGNWEQWNDAACPGADATIRFDAVVPVPMERVTSLRGEETRLRQAGMLPARADQGIRWCAHQFNGRGYRPDKRYICILPGVCNGDGVEVVLEIGIVKGCRFGRLVPCTADWFYERHTVLCWRA